MTYPRAVRLIEVGPRDGLQNEPAEIPIPAKIELIESLVDAGLRTVEAGSFVSPQWVPQMAGTGEVLKHLHRVRGVSYPVLVPNLKGLDAAIEAGADHIAVFAAASESFSRHNINCSIAESFVRLRPVVEGALARNLKVRGYVSCVLGCPYEGEVPVSRVVSVSRELFAMGCSEISLGDTIGVGTPVKAQKMVEAVASGVPIEQLAVHFHDTWGQALANILGCLELGISAVDSSVAGLGGCPYAAGATGNVATEDVVYMLHGVGIETGVNLQKVAAVGWMISRVLGREPGSKAAVAMQRTSQGSKTEPTRKS